MAKEKCLNCGCGIGDLETPYVWHERIVCRACYAKLQPKSGMSKWIALVATTVAVGIAAFAIIRSVGPKPPSGDGSSSITSGSQQAANPRAVTSAGPPNVVPATAQKNLSSDSSAEVLARVATENERARQQAATLAAENERLRLQTAALAATPPPTAAIQSPPKLGRLIGSAWLTTNGGASNLMRGLQVTVLTPTIDSRPIVATAVAGIPRLQKEIDASKSLMLDAPPDLLEGFKRDLLDDQARIARIQKLVSNPPPTLDLAQAYSYLKDGSVTSANRANEIPDLPLARITVRYTKTNVDGKYTIADLAPGDYYIYASFISSSMGVDWLIPVQITAGEEKTLDLDNTNAATVRNH